jgi:hypothetical protein
MLKFMRRRPRGTVLPTTLAVAVTGVGFGAWAAFNNAGSDTLGDVAPDVIVASAADLTYKAFGSGEAEKRLVAGTQYAGFMSRNFKSTVLTDHGTWAPTPNNVLGLDAAVIVEPSTSDRAKNLALAQDPNNPGKALPNSDLALVLGGKDAAGTTDACRHPDRLAALDRLTQAMHVDQIDHFYRRNDASGTTDTIRERVLTNNTGKGGRFCNGQAPGGVKASNGYVYTNMDAEDMDPIRRDCVAASARKKATKCTFWPYVTVACTAGSTSNATNAPTIPAGIPCTQGLVVALSETDPEASDVTVSIAHRVGDDTKVLGFAGREAVRQTGSPTAGPTLNKRSFADDNVRSADYPLARRLFLNHGNALPASLAAQMAEEEKLYNFATDPADGRCNMHPIMKKWGFISCYKNCTIPPAGYTLCDDGTIPAAEETMSLCVAADRSCASTDTCCSTGAACPTSGTCPAPNAGGDGWACAVDSDCNAGLTCKDLAGVSRVCAP